MRSYGTFNRVIWKIFQTVRLIETVLIIETLEYKLRLENSDFADSTDIVNYENFQIGLKNPK